MKNEKFWLDIQTKCSDIANKILNAAIDAEQTFKYKWPKQMLQRLPMVLAQVTAGTTCENLVNKIKETSCKRNY